MIIFPLALSRFVGIWLPVFFFNGTEDRSFRLFWDKLLSFIALFQSAFPGITTASSYEKEAFWLFTAILASFMNHILEKKFRSGATPALFFVVRLCPAKYSNESLSSSSWFCDLFIPGVPKWYGVLLVAVESNGSIAVFFTCSGCCNFYLLRFTFMIILENLVFNIFRFENYQWTKVRQLTVNDKLFSINLYVLRRFNYSFWRNKNTEGNSFWIYKYETFLSTYKNWTHLIFWHVYIRQTSEPVDTWYFWSSPVHIFIRRAHFFRASGDQHVSNVVGCVSRPSLKKFTNRFI